MNTTEAIWARSATSAVAGMPTPTRSGARKAIGQAREVA